MSVSAPYDFLGIDSTANKKEIKSAYRKKALELHPDKNPDDEEADKKFQELQDIYELLLDDKKRAEINKKIAAEEERKKRWESVDQEKKKFGDLLFKKEQEAKSHREDTGVNAIRKKNADLLNDYNEKKCRNVKRKFCEVQKTKEDNESKAEAQSFETLEEETMRLLMEAARKQK